MIAAAATLDPPRELYAVIETMLPEEVQGGRCLELWAPRGVRRAGWAHAVQVLASEPGHDHHQQQRQHQYHQAPAQHQPMGCWPAEAGGLETDGGAGAVRCSAMALDCQGAAEDAPMG